MSFFPNRCQHLKINGTQCGSPALRRNRFCFFHKRHQEERIRLNSDRARRGSATFILPVLEDANSIQIALMQIMRALLSHRIDHKTASLLLYALQTASTNLRMTDFKPFRHDVILDPRDAANSVLGSNLWDDDDFEEEEEEEDEDIEAEAARAQQRVFEAKKKHEATMRAWVAAHPDYRIFRDHLGRPQLEFTGSVPGYSAPPAPAPTPKPAPNAPSVPLPEPQMNPAKKKPAAEATPAEVRAQISAIVRENLPQLTRVLTDAKEKEERKKEEKKKEEKKNL
jgi:hypothetical protein